MSTEQISLMIALSAVLISPFVSWKIAKKQISAQVISTNRQQWINELRDTISEFLRDAKSLSTGFLSKEKAFSRFELMALNLNRMELLINPKEPDHAELIRLAQSTLEHVRQTLIAKYASKEVTNRTERKTAIAAIPPVAQRIFKQEWERVKSAS